MGRAPSQEVAILLPLQFHKYFGRRMCAGYKTEGEDTITVCWDLKVRWGTYSSQQPVSVWAHKGNNRGSTGHFGRQRQGPRPPEPRSGTTSWRNWSPSARRPVRMSQTRVRKTNTPRPRGGTLHGLMDKPTFCVCLKINPADILIVLLVRCFQREKPLGSFLILKRTFYNGWVHYI